MEKLISWINMLPADYILYAVLGNISEAKPVVAYVSTTGKSDLTALWQDTPYAGWLEGMPYLVPLERNSPFLQWVAQTPYSDWGWLTASRFSPEEIRKQIRSITQVLMPDGKCVIFRYWDGRHFYPALRYQKQKEEMLIPVLSHYYINHRAIEIAGDTVFREPKNFPWWQVDPELLKVLMQNDTTHLENQLTDQLRKSSPELYMKYPKENLIYKARYYLNQNGTGDLSTLYKRFKNHLQEEP